MADAKSAVADRNTKIADLLKVLQPMVQEIKNKSPYTTSIGESLDVIGAEDSFNPLTFKTTLKSTVFNNYVEIKFVKKGLTGVNIYSRLKGQSEWDFLAFDTTSPYFDTRSIASPGTIETREYIAYGVVKDKEMPVASDIAEALFPG